MSGTSPTRLIAFLWLLGSLGTRVLNERRESRYGGTSDYRATDSHIRSNPEGRCTRTRRRYISCKSLHSNSSCRKKTNSAMERFECPGFDSRYCMLTTVAEWFGIIPSTPERPIRVRRSHGRETAERRKLSPNPIEAKGA